MIDIILAMNIQNSFLSEKGSVYVGEKAEILKVRLSDYLSDFTKKKIFFREKHAKSDTYFVNDKTHSVVKTHDFPIHESLKKYATDFFDKTKYSAFYNTKFESFLKREKVLNIGLVGLETHTSVLFTASELRNRGYEVTVIEPCTLSRDDYMHNYAIALMRNSLGAYLHSPLKKKKC